MHILNTRTSSDISLQPNVDVKTTHQNNEQGNILNNIHDVKTHLHALARKNIQTVQT